MTFEEKEEEWGNPAVVIDQLMEVIHQSNYSVDVIKAAAGRLQEYDSWYSDGSYLPSIVDLLHYGTPERVLYLHLESTPVLQDKDDLEALMSSRNPSRPSGSLQSLKISTRLSDVGRMMPILRHFPRIKFFRKYSVSLA